MPVNTLLQVRRGTSSDWSTANGGNGSVLGAGEIGLDTTTDRVKIGDGTTAWNSLEFLSIAFDDIHTAGGSGVSLTKVTDSNSQVTGISLSANIVAGSNITLSNDGGQITINSTATSSVQPEDVQDIIGTGLNATSGLSLNYRDSDNTIDIGIDATAGTVTASKPVVVDSNKDITGFRNVTIGGDLTVNGTTTTVNSTVVSVDDPVIRVGGDTVPGSDDNKDRGVEFLYHDGSVAKSGFFGYDDSSGKFTFIPDATNTSEVFGGTKGELDATVDFSNLANVDITNAHINASAAIAVSKLAASNVTVGTTAITLGNSSTSVSGMAIFAGTNAGNPVVISYASIDGGSP
jgi:hypothetical protein